MIVKVLYRNAFSSQTEVKLLNLSKVFNKKPITLADEIFATTPKTMKSRWAPTTKPRIGRGNDETEKEFRKQWWRMQKQRIDWKQIISPCADHTVTGETLPGWGIENMTSLETSYVEYMEVRPAGQFSRFFIRTKTADNRNKTIGGDFWKVI